MSTRSSSLTRAVADRAFALPAASRSERLARLAGGLALALAAGVATDWAWTLARTPRAPAGDGPSPAQSVAPRESATERAEAIAAAALFGLATDPGATAAMASPTGVRLKGVMGRHGPRPGGAIFNIGGADEYVPLGGDIAPGVVLAEVRATHVMVRRAGQLERIDLEEAISRSSTPGLAAQPGNAPRALLPGAPVPGPGQPMVSPGLPGAGLSAGGSPNPPIPGPPMPNVTLGGPIPLQGLPPAQPGAPTGPPPSRVILPGR